MREPIVITAQDGRRIDAVHIRMTYTAPDDTTTEVVIALDAAMLRLSGDPRKAIADEVWLYGDDFAKAVATKGKPPAPPEPDPRNLQNIVW